MIITCSKEGAVVEAIILVMDGKGNKKLPIGKQWPTLSGFGAMLKGIVDNVFIAHSKVHNVHGKKHNCLVVVRKYQLELVVIVFPWNDRVQDVKTYPC